MASYKAITIFYKQTLVLIIIIIIIMVYLQYSNKREALTTVNAVYTIKKIKLSKILITYKDKISQNNNIKTCW